MGIFFSFLVCAHQAQAVPGPRLAAALQVARDHYCGLTAPVHSWLIEHTQLEHKLCTEADKATEKKWNKDERDERGRGRDGKGSGKEEEGIGEWQKWKSNFCWLGPSIGINAKGYLFISSWGRKIKCGMCPDGIGLHQVTILQMQGAMVSRKGQIFSPDILDILDYQIWWKAQREKA